MTTNDVIRRKKFNFCLYKNAIRFSTMNYNVFINYWRKLRSAFEKKSYHTGIQNKKKKKIAIDNDKFYRHRKEIYFNLKVLVIMRWCLTRVNTN